MQDPSIRQHPSGHPRSPLWYLRRVSGENCPMNDIGPYSNYRLTVRLELANRPGMFAQVAATLAAEGANLGAVDLVSATADRMIRDVTFDVRDETHGDRV